MNQELHEVKSFKYWVVPIHVLFAIHEDNYNPEMLFKFKIS